jgi:hypothetical protein
MCTSMCSNIAVREFLLVMSLLLGYGAGDLAVGDNSPHFINKSTTDQSKVALTLHVSNGFLNDIHKSKLEYLDFSFVSIINTQINSFQLRENSRLEERFRTLSSQVASQLQSTHRSGRKRQLFVQCQRLVAVYSEELENVKEISFRLSQFKKENIVLEDRCKNLLSELLQATNSDHADTDLSEQNSKMEEYITYIQQNAFLENTGKKLDDLEDKHFHRKLRTIENHSEKVMWFAETFGLIPKIIKCETLGGKQCDLILNKTGNNRKSHYADLEIAEKDKLKSLVNILDRFAVSDAAYSELSLKFNGMPRKYMIVQCRNDMDSIFHIERAPGGVPGAYMSFRDELSKQIRLIISSQGDKGDTESFQVKFSGDGAKTSRLSNFVNFSFSIIQPHKKQSSLEQKVVAIMKCQENYEVLQRVCAPLFNEVNTINKDRKIIVDGIEYEIELLCGGDMKFIEIMLGLCGANGNYGCPWCKVHKNDRHDCSKDWDFYHTDSQTRTIDELNEDFRIKKYGAQRKPLLNIEPSHMVPDELHLLLRISGILLRNLIDDANDMDARDQVETGKQCSPTRLDSLTDQIRKCGVTFNTWTRKGDTELQWTALSGGDIKKLLDNLPDKLFFNIHDETHDKTVKLWKDFGELYRYICSKQLEAEGPRQIFDRCKGWLGQFLDLGARRKGYRKSNVTPYMHCLVYHIPYFMSTYGPLKLFTGQGIEKANDDIKKIFHTKCNKFDAPKDVLKTRKRTETAHDSNLTRTKRAYLKRNTQYWESEKSHASNVKRQKILDEMTKADERESLSRTSSLLTHTDDGDDELSSLTVTDLKEQLTAFGVKTRLRRKDKLIELLKEHRQKVGEGGVVQ